MLTPACCLLAPLLVAVAASHHPGPHRATAGAPSTPRDWARLDEGDEPKVSIGSKGFRVTSADGESSIKIGGRLQTDANAHSGEGPALDPLIHDGTELRRARFEMKGTLPDDLSWAAEVDFANNRTSLKDFWVGMEHDDGLMTYFGHQKQPFSLDVEMSANDMPFVERGVDSALLFPFVDRAIGFRIQDSFDSIFYAAGLYGESVSPNAVDDEGYGASGRLIWAPLIADDEVVHLGARLAYRMTDDGDETVRVRDETTNISEFSVVDTGDIPGVDAVQLHGVEAVWATGRYSLGGEFNQASVERSGEDFDFESWRVEGTCTLTGESRAEAYRLDAGEFKRIRAAEQGGRVWETAARFSSIDLNDGSLRGGREEVGSLGLNWYYSQNLRLMWNWSHILSTHGGSPETRAAEGLDAFTMRVQVTF